MRRLGCWAQRRWAPGRRGVDPLLAETPGRGRGIPEGIPEFRCVPALGPCARSRQRAAGRGEPLPLHPRPTSPSLTWFRPQESGGRRRGCSASRSGCSLVGDRPSTQKSEPSSTRVRKTPPRLYLASPSRRVGGVREPGVPGAPPPTPRDCWDAGPGGPSGGGRLSPARPGSSGLSPARVLLGFFIWAPTAAFTWSANLLPSSPPGEFRALSGPVVQAEIPRPRDVK